MAKRKKRRGGSRSKPAEAEEIEATEEEEAEGVEEDDDAAEASAPEEAPSRPLSPGVPDPDGENVSTGGGLVMMGIVFGLIVLAVAAQYFME
ncbi:MAG: hypothetical protein VYE22_18760 [Myxococcota bacterium]|nr:hypothetical protein [Myxococcota bacterium]